MARFLQGTPRCLVGYDIEPFDAILEIVNLAQRRDSAFSTFSYGMKQRLAIARALLRQPNILIFDEAASNLDQHTAELFAQTINKLKGKVTILFITHQLPKGLAVDEAILLGKETINQTEQVEVPVNDDVSGNERKET